MGYKYLQILNNLDCDYNNIMCIKEGENTELVIPGDGSVILCRFYSDSPVIDYSDEDELEDCAFGISVLSVNGEEYSIGLDEDGNIVSNDAGIAFEMEYFYNISTKDELDCLIKNVDIDSGVYDAIEELGIILA